MTAVPVPASGVQLEDQLVVLFEGAPMDPLRPELLDASPALAVKGDPATPWVAPAWLLWVLLALVGQRRRSAG